MILYVYVLHWKLFFRIAVFKKTKSAASKIRIDIEAVLDYSLNVSAYHSGQRSAAWPRAWRLEESSPGATATDARLITFPDFIPANVLRIF